MNLTKTRNTTKYLAIKELSDENKTYSISALCEFAGIARSAYYKWLGHVNSDNDNLNERIADTITKIHDKHPDMGYRRIRDTLAHDYKIAVNDKRVLRICRKKKIQSYIKHRYNCCTKPASDPAYVAENILNREFKSDMINQKWVTDVSEFKYGVGEDDKKGKLYLSVILDLCDRRPVAFVYSTRNDNPLVFDTFDKAVAANPGDSVQNQQSGNNAEAEIYQSQGDPADQESAQEETYDIQYITGNILYSDENTITVEVGESGNYYNMVFNIENAVLNIANGRAVRYGLNVDLEYYSQNNVNIVIMLTSDGEEYLPSSTLEEAQKMTDEYVPDVSESENEDFEDTSPSEY